MKKKLLSLCPIADEAAKKRMAEFYDITELEKCTEEELFARAPKLSGSSHAAPDVVQSFAMGRRSTTATYGTSSMGMTRSGKSR